MHRLALTDGVVTVRSPRPEDADAIIAGRDAVVRRFLGPGTDDPSPTGCIVVEGAVVGWVDYDHDPDHGWLGDEEVNVGYAVFAPHRGRGYATRAVELLLQHLATTTGYGYATALIDPQNAPSLAVALRCGFALKGQVRDQHLLSRPLR